MARSVEQLVNQQILRWLKEQQREDRVPESRVQEAQRPMITISRQFGALGGEIGRRVAEQLDMGFYAQELVHEVARRADVRKQVVEALDERTQSRLEAWIDDMMRMRSFTQSDYVRSLSETILALARHRSGVIIGRGGHLILDPHRTLRVRAYAVVEHRVQCIAQRDGMTLDEARHKVARVDEERRVFYARYFQNDFAQPHHFDMLLNTATMSLDECASAIVHMFRTRFGDPR